MLQAKITVRDKGAAKFKYEVRRKMDRRLDYFGRYNERVMKGFVGTPSPVKHKVHAGPGDPPYLQTGALHDAITSKVEKTTRLSKLYVGIPRGPRARIRYKHGRRLTRNIPVWLYAIIVEQGGHNLKAPHPFMKPTFDAAIPMIDEMLLKKL